MPNEILYIRDSAGIKFQLKLAIFNIRSELTRKNFLLSKNEPQHWILHIRISLGIKSYFEQTILNFGTRFVQTGNLWSNTEKVSMTIKFYIFQLLGKGENYHWRGEYYHWILNIRISLGTTFAQKEYFRSKTKKAESLLSSTYSSYNSGHNVLRLLDALPNFVFTTS